MKNKLPYYKKYPRDFIEGTIGMDLELKGAYAIIIDLIYMQSGALPDDEKYICGLLGCSVRRWKLIRQQLIDLGKIKTNGHIISNSRADFELESLRSFSARQSENASKSKENNDIAEAVAFPKASQPEPEPEPEVKRSPSAPKKGTRLPDDFEPDLEYAEAKGMLKSQAIIEATKFKNYWAALPGAKAVKLDWPRTWQNWVITSLERANRGRAPPQKSEFQQQQDRIRAELGAKDGKPTGDDKQPTLDLGQADFRRH